MLTDEWKSAPRNHAALLMFVLTTAVALTVVPWYGFTHGYHLAAWIWFAVFLAITELSITCGYHRLFAHATFEANPVLKIVFLLFGGMALQNSALLWSAGHRTHHRYIDDPERDPYCARRGFWFSHIGWMLRNYPSGKPDLSCVRDLQNDRWVSWQHRHYLWVAVPMNLCLPLLAGWADGDIVGTFLLAGVLRLVVSHHLTFCINSLAHMIGTQPYTGDNTARDNAIVAVLTFGEGYHNFHHMFAHDYRNGVRWWQWDPSKWLIAGLSWCGLTKNLKRVSWFRIQRALLDTQFRRAELQIARSPAGTHLEHLKARITEEYAAFHSAVSTWNKLREQRVHDAKRVMIQRWERSIVQSRLKELEYSLRLQYRRMAVLRAQLE